MYCPNCGRRLLNNATKCNNCGFYFQPQQPTNPQKQSSGNPIGCLTVIIALIVVVMIFGGGSKNKKEDTGNDNKTTTSTTQVNTTQSTTEETTEITTEQTISDKEIVFRDLQWGLPYTDVELQLSELGLWTLEGESYKTYSIDDIVLGDYKGKQFKQNDINIIANAMYGEIEVAGYTTSDVNLYFAYVPVDGILTKTEEDSSMYGAQYIFEPSNIEAMKNDLVDKISTSYGQYSEAKEDSEEMLILNEETNEYEWDSVYYTYTYWYGANNTMLVVRTEDYPEYAWSDDKIYVSYIWLEGDNLLQLASDTLTQNLEDEEAQIYNDGNDNGL